MRTMYLTYLQIGVVSWRMRIPEKKPLVKPDFFKPYGKE